MAEEGFSATAINSIVLVGAEGLGLRLRDRFADSGLITTLLTDAAELENHLVGADLILENLPPSAGDKTNFFSRCSAGKSSLTLSTTSTIGITRLAAATARPQRFVGLHFVLNTNNGDWLVEIARALQTAESTVRLCRDLAQRAGITSIEVEDSPGLILDRVMCCLINEAAFMLMSGVVTSAESTDEIVRIRRNWLKGPFQIADEMGIDYVVGTLEMLAEEKGSRYLPCRLLRRMNEANRLGQKTGSGFYRYG